MTDNLEKRLDRLEDKFDVLDNKLDQISDKLNNLTIDLTKMLLENVETNRTSCLLVSGKKASTSLMTWALGIAFTIIIGCYGYAFSLHLRISEIAERIAKFM